MQGIYPTKRARRLRVGTPCCRVKSPSACCASFTSTVRVAAIRMKRGVRTRYPNTHIINSTQRAVKYRHGITKRREMVVRAQGSERERTTRLFLRMIDPFDTCACLCSNVLVVRIASFRQRNEKIIVGTRQDFALWSRRMRKCTPSSFVPTERATDVCVKRTP